MQHFYLNTCCSKTVCVGTEDSQNSRTGFGWNERPYHHIWTSKEAKTQELSHWYTDTGFVMSFSGKQEISEYFSQSPFMSNIHFLM